MSNLARDSKHDSSEWVELLKNAALSNLEQELEGLLKSDNLEKYSRTSIRKLHLTQIGLLSPVCTGIILTRTLRKEILIHIDDFLRQHKKFKLETEFTPNISLNRIAKKLNIFKIISLGNISLGKSGATLFWVQYIVGEETRLGVLKYFRSTTDFECELRNHENIKSSWLSDLIPELPRVDADSLIFLSPCAVSLVELDPRSLVLNHFITKRNKSIVNSVAKRLGADYSTMYLNEFRAKKEGGTCSRFKAWTRGLDHWKNSGIVFSDKNCWHECGLPNKNEKFIISSSKYNWNPLYLIESCSQFKDAQNINWIEMHQHGDLNINNVLIDIRKSNQLQFVDFEKSGISSGLLDLCWLSLWSLRSSCTHPSTSTVALKDLVDSFALSTKGQESHIDLKEFEMGINFVRMIFNDFSILKPEERDLIYQQLEITMATAALAMACYEVRSFSRKLDQNIDTVGFDIEDQGTDENCIWATVFLTISSACISPHIEMPPGGELAVDMDILWSTQTYRQQMYD